ncbi:29767_t:CDS:2 [Gigaspora margarita]|uniref:29767_t:CDS:1 n=1 Tax=Gigaspora margarita TaxID=4874 RepID=A0ABN7UP64_GIGMA|nr:29767_t:CDS:2 [Gigaspora margarita]
MQQGLTISKINNSNRDCNEISTQDFVELDQFSLNLDQLINNEKMALICNIICQKIKTSYQFS